MDVVILSNKLPFADEIARSVLFKTTTFHSEVQKNIRKAVSKAIHELWVDIFPFEYVVSLRTIREKVDEIFLSYTNVVVKAGHKRDKRTLKLDFIKTRSYLFDAMSKRHLKSLQANHKKLYDFYIDQQTHRYMSVVDFSRKSFNEAEDNENSNLGRKSTKVSSIEKLYTVESMEIDSDEKFIPMTR